MPDPFELALNGGTGKAAPPRAVDPFDAALGSGPVNAVNDDPFERALQDDPQRSTTGLERVLDVLAIPSHAVAGAVQGGIRDGVGGAVRGVAKGVRDRTTFGDVLKEDAGVQGLAAPGLGLVLDIALDPTTYLSSGMTAAGKAAKVATLGSKVAELSGDAARVAEAGKRLAEAGELGANLAEQASRGQRAVVAFGGKPVLPRGANEAVYRVIDKVTGRLGETDAAQAIRKAFVVAPELKGLDREVYLARQAELRAASRVAQKRADEQMAPVAREISKLVRTHGLNPTATQRALSDAVELARPRFTTDATGTRHAMESAEQAVVRSVDDAMRLFGGPAELKPHMEELVTRINAINATNIAAEQAAGIPIGELSDETINYLFRSVRPDAADELAKAGVTPEAIMQRGVSSAHKSQKTRGFRGLTISEVNDLARKGELSIDGVLLPVLKHGLFVENPLVATSMRSAASGRVQAAAQLLEDYARTAGGILDPKDHTPAALEGERDLFRGRGLVKVGGDVTGTREVWLPPEVAVPFTAHYTAVQRPSYFLRAWDASNQLWKKYTLGIFPVYHTRNLIGDAWNAVVLGGQDLARYGDSMAALRTPDRVFRLGGKAVTGKEVTDLAERLGVMDGATADLVGAMGALRGMPEGALERLGAGLDENRVLRLAQRTGQARENWQRLALFMDRLGKGDAPEVAAMNVKRHLFDYGELTATEQGAFRRLAPFYAFTRNNVPLQLSYLFEKPGAVAGIQHLREESSPDGSLGLENGAPLPRFLAESLPLRIGSNAEGNPQFLRGEGWIPATDLNTALDPGVGLNRLVSMLSPFIQQPVETAFNVDLFRSDLGSGKFEPQERFPGETETLLGVPLNKRYVRAPLENIRALMELDKLNPGGAFGDSEGGPFGAPRPHPDPSGAVRGLSLIAGRGYAVDSETEAMRANNRLEREISRLKSELTRAMMRGDGPNIAALERRLAELEQY